jgi:hypothetical protein
MVFQPSPSGTPDPVCPTSRTARDPATRAASIQAFHRIRVSRNRSDRRIRLSVPSNNGFVPAVRPTNEAPASASLNRRFESRTCCVLSADADPDTVIMSSPKSFQQSRYSVNPLRQNRRRKVALTGGLRDSRFRDVRVQFRRRSSRIWKSLLVDTGIREKRPRRAKNRSATTNQFARRLELHIPPFDSHVSRLRN